MKKHTSLFVIIAAAYVLFVSFDTWKAYQGQDGLGKCSKWNVLGRFINWRVSSAATPTISEVTGAGNDWSNATDYVKGGAV